MSIETSCPACGNRLRLADEHAGKTGRCPACRTEFPIPVSESIPPLGGSLPLPHTTQPPLQSEIQGAAFDSVNPYASPSSLSSSGQPAYGGPPSDANLQAATILGILSIVTGALSFCCCLAMFVSFPIGLVGLILSLQVSAAKRTTPLMLNAIGLIMPILWFLFMMAISAVQTINAPPIAPAPVIAPPAFEIPLEEGPAKE